MKEKKKKQAMSLKKLKHSETASAITQAIGSKKPPYNKASMMSNIKEEGVPYSRDVPSPDKTRISEKQPLDISQIT